MVKRIILATILLSFANVYASFAQESVTPDSLLNKQDKATSPLLPDSLRLQPNRQLPLIPPAEIQRTESLMNQSVGNRMELNLKDTIREPALMLPPEFRPSLYFNLGASRWDMPVMGATITFSPTLNYQVTKDLSFYGGVSFTQFPNLWYVQSLIAPNWETKSNIIANGFVGVSYNLFDRIMLHGSYQRSLYNQLPRNLMMFAPGQNVVVAGASFDLYHGLGVTVDHVWEFDRYGHRIQGFRYSPYIDLPKLIKFLRQ